MTERGILANPLTDVVPVEVPLANAPLVRVIVQIKFSEVLSVESAEVVAPFQSELGGTYSVLTRELGVSAPVHFQGASPPRPMTHWRFADAATNWQWRASLTSQFVTLEVSRYTSRGELMERLRSLFFAVQKHVRPTLVLRVGVRYINRITGKELKDVSELVRPEIAGVVGTNMAAMVGLAVSETIFHLAEGRKMGARWGMIPPNVTVDPMSVEPIAEPCFLLDLDVFDEAATAFEPEELVSRCESFAQRSYTFFRWAVTPEFLRRFGGYV